MAKSLTPAEAAQALGVGRNFLYDLLHSGKLRATKKGKQWRIPERSIQERLDRLAAANSK